VSRERKQVPLRLDPAVHDALARWAADELRSLTRRSRCCSGEPSMTRAECRRRPPRHPAAAGPRAKRLSAPDRLKHSHAEADTRRWTT
jgi:hypothetical protein